MAVLRDVTPLVEPISLDEAFLDVAGAHRSLGTGPEIGELLRRRIRAETGLTASVGAATTKLLAKLASDLAKPDGLLVVEPGTELEFLHPLPVTRLWGVGPATRRGSSASGSRPSATWPICRSRRWCASWARRPARTCTRWRWNRDDRAVEPDRAMKSIGHEETFATDRTDLDGLERDALRMADAVAARLRERGEDRADGAAQGALRRLPDDHPVAHAADARPISRARSATPRATCCARWTWRTASGCSGCRSSSSRTGVAVQGRLELDDALGPRRPSDRRALEDALDTVRERFGDATRWARPRSSSGADSAPVGVPACGAPRTIPTTAGPTDREEEAR